MKFSLIMALLGTSLIQAINLDAVANLKASTHVVVNDGPTNGEMNEEEKDSLIQVLCPGVVATSYSLASGKSSTCNHGAATVALVQETSD